MKKIISDFVLKPVQRAKMIYICVLCCKRVTAKNSSLRSASALKRVFNASLVLWLKGQFKLYELK